MNTLFKSTIALAVSLLLAAGTGLPVLAQGGGINDADIEQIGENLDAEIDQEGVGQQASIRQGDPGGTVEANFKAEINQSVADNSASIVQEGAANPTANIEQIGTGNEGFQGQFLFGSGLSGAKAEMSLVQIGDDMSAEQIQSGGFGGSLVGAPESAILQEGTLHRAETIQSIGSPTERRAEVEQEGTAHDAFIRQGASLSSGLAAASIQQSGANNTARITQD